MALGLRDPFTSLFDWRDRMGPWFADAPQGALAETRRPERGLAPAADIDVTDDAYVIQVDLPGVRKEDINVAIDGNELSIEAVREHETEDETETMARRERFRGLYKRAFTLPNQIDGDKLSAAYRDGVLTVTIPKAETAKPKAIEVK